MHSVMPASIPVLECVTNVSENLQSCTEDGRRPPGVDFQELASNCPELLRSKGVVVSVGSKVRMKFGQVSIRETSVSKPSVTRRKAIDTAKTGGARILWDKSVGYLGTGQMAVGV